MAVAAIGVGATAVGYLVYFWVIRQAGPVVASTVTLLVPLSGTAISVAWLNEPLTVAFVIGTLVILLSVAALIWSSAQPSDEPAGTDAAADQPAHQRDDHGLDASPARRAEDGSH